MIYDKIKIYMQYILPKHLLTLAVGFFASAKLGKVTTFAIEKFVKFYDINTSEMQKQISDYTTFNHFFARALKKGARPINQDNNTVISPVDGKISQYGSLIENLQIQAKNHYFTTDALLASAKDAAIFNGGDFITLYLSPRDYHRVHMPLDGKLLRAIYIPGELFSVNPLYVKNIPELFSRNERLCCIFDTKVGKIAIVFVGATIVRSIITSWDGTVAPQKFPQLNPVSYTKRNITFQKGDEIGKFAMGSTIICLFEKNKINFSYLSNEKQIFMGEKIAVIKNIKATPKVIKNKTKTSKAIK